MTKSNKKDSNKNSVGIVTSIFNREVAQLEFNSCLNTLLENGVSKNKIFSINVPGALEIPLILKNLAQSKNFDALIAFGVIVRGETFHFEIVAMESASGLSNVALNFNIPIANGILAVENTEQAFDRAEKKGSDCALVVIEMINLLQQIEEYSGDGSDFGKNHQSS